jgi:alkanesulfonate monooxygenase SsuD/methylene tetrahydromethanopterin reductase-like flavin-dependent oxidoreductase (luciferase family)
MKISAFHLMPHRELPADFEKRYPSVWVTPPWWELADPARVGQYYNWTLDELMFAARAGFDGVCTNEHHQNAYGFMPSPNIMGAVLAKATNGSNVAIVQMGATLPTSNPPIRVAEEYAMLDCISGGRLVAGLPLGSAMDVNLCYGITPMEHRERYREAFALTLKAWQSRELFAWNGRYYQLANVNLWPRPVQQPHPPVWVAAESPATIEWTAGHGFGMATIFLPTEMVAEKKRFYLEAGAAAGQPVGVGHFMLVRNVFVAPTDEEAMAEAEPALTHMLILFKDAAVPPDLSLLPDSYAFHREAFRAFEEPPESFDDVVGAGLVLCGSPETVRRQLQEQIEAVGLRQVCLLFAFGNLPHEKVMRSLRLFASEVMPALRPG